MLPQVLRGRCAGTPFSGQAGDVLSLPYMLPTITEIEQGIETEVNNFKGRLDRSLSS